MLHWYLLAKDAMRPATLQTARQAARAACGLVAWGGPDFREVTPPNVRARLLVLGAVETLPLGGGVFIGSYFEPIVPFAGAAAVGLALCVLLCWLLRHQTPPTVIHAVADAAAETAVPAGCPER